MDFSEIFRARIVAFSPDGVSILATVEDRVVVRRADTLSITHTWTLTAIHATSALGSRGGESIEISDASWSCDSRYILASRNGVVHVFDVQEKGWGASIHTGVEGLTRTLWAPDGRHIVCFSEWGLRLTVWSLSTAVATYIQFPKYPGRGYAFSNDSRLFVVAERHKSRDTIGIYDCTAGYVLRRNFIAPTSSLASLELSPAGDLISIWEGPLEYKLYLVNMAGQVMATYIPEADPGLGIRCVAWHPSGSMLAVSGYDDTIHILSATGLRTLAIFELKSRIPGSVTLWREPTGWIESTHGRGFLSYNRIPVPTSSVVDAKSTNGGAIELSWNASGSMLLARWGRCGNVVHLYSFPGGGLSVRPALKTVIEQGSAVQSVRWHPTRTGLAIGCGTGAVYLWRDESEEWTDGGEVAECVAIPAKNFRAREIGWGGGRGLILADRDAYVVAYEVDETG